MQRSLVLVTVDCLRADHVGFMGYSRPTTPFLDSLAHESFVTPAAVVAGAPTYYSLPAILASRYPLAFGRDIVGLAPEESTLASDLQGQGYETAAFIAANPYIAPRFGYQRGFDVFRDFLENSSAVNPGDSNPDRANNRFASSVNRRLQKLRPSMGPLRILYDELYFQYCQRLTPVPDSLDQLRRFPAADEIVDSACSWLQSVQGNPFFLWLHLMDPHSPYYPKEEALALMGSAQVTPSRARYLNSIWNRSDVRVRRLSRYRESVVSLYDAGIRWVDVQLARLVHQLKQLDRWSSSVFAVTADHGEEFLEHEGRYHPCTGLMEELIRVPLLIRVPGTPKKDVSSSPFSLLDLSPTLLDAMEIGVSPPTFRGASRWTQLCNGDTWDAVGITECVDGCRNPFRLESRMGPRLLALRNERFKLVIRFEPFREELYDLVSDPGEQAPLAPTAQQGVRRRLLEAARDHVSRSLQERDGRVRMQTRLRELQLEWMHFTPQKLGVAAIDFGS